MCDGMSGLGEWRVLDIKDILGGGEAGYLAML
jgi:hypothetical protein